jgi:pimeloyl-ACP methyl ester carboxylesterase
MLYGALWRKSRYLIRRLGRGTPAQTRKPLVRDDPKQRKYLLFVSSLQRWAKYLLGGLAIFLFLLAVAGAVYQLINTSRDKTKYPPPGQLVDVGGYRLHIYCTGNGNPTVILDSMGDGMSANWGWVQPKVAHVTRVCSYDRAGFGWSDPGPAPRDAQHAAEELHTLLGKVGIVSPYVLVGHSFGANVARVYAGRYPAEVGGMVFVDPGLLYRDPRLARVYREEEESSERLMIVAPFLARLGLFRLSGQGSVLSQDLPPRQSAEFTASYASTQHWDALQAQNVAFPQTSAEVQNITSLGDLPLVVLSASLPTDETRRISTEINADLVRLSSKGSHRVVEEATHADLANNSRHAEVTSAAILQVVETVRINHSLVP